MFIQFDYPQIRTEPQLSSKNESIISNSYLNFNRDIYT